MVTDLSSNGVSSCDRHSIGEKRKKKNKHFQLNKFPNQLNELINLYEINEQYDGNKIIETFV